MLEQNELFLLLSFSCWFGVLPASCGFLYAVPQRPFYVFFEQDPWRAAGGGPGTPGGAGAAR